MAKVGPLQACGKLSTAELNGMVTAAGLPNIVGLMSRPDLIPVIEAQVDALALARG